MHRLGQIQQNFCAKVNEDPGANCSSSINRVATAQVAARMLRYDNTDFFNNLPKSPVSMHKKELIGKARKFFNEQQTKLHVLFSQTDIQSKFNDSFIETKYNFYKNFLKIIQTQSNLLNA